MTKETKDGYIIDFISGQEIKATPEEIEAVQVFAKQLVEDYGYPKSHIQTRPQFRVKVRPSDTKKEYSVDIAVFPDDKKQEDDVYIIVECKKKNRKDGKIQLQNYLRFSKAFLGVWFNGDERLFLRKVEKAGRIEFEEIPNIPQYGQRVEDIGKFRRKDLKPTHNLKATFKAIRNHLVANTVGATRDEVLAQQLINLIFYKIYDERFTEPNDDFIVVKSKKIIKLNSLSLSIINKAQNYFYQKIGIDFNKCQKEKYYSVNLSNISRENLWTPSYSYPLYVNTLKTIQQKWHIIPLGEIATVKKGDEVGSANYSVGLNKKDNDIPFIRTSDLINYEIDQSPDYYIPNEIYQDLKQDVKAGDVLFIKDGKVGMSAMFTKSDKAIVASGIVRLRLKAEAKKYNLTPEYLFIVLSLKETGIYPAIRRTVVASTIPHLREESLKEFEILILDKNSINEITKLVKKAFELKDEKKKLIKEVREEIDSYFDI